MRRGFNAYFPMPFRKSAKVELVYDGPLAPGDELWKIMPCYSYVSYRTVKKMPADTGYFHASWRQEGLLLGKRDYVALEAKGKGKFVGWNVTVRSPGRDGYPVDENEKFYIDGEPTASIEFQGLEDSFGFSWGFPESESMFPLTGYFPFLKGAAAYRFFIAGRHQLREVAARGDRLRRERGPVLPARVLQARQHAAILHHGLLVSGGAARAACRRCRPPPSARPRPEEPFWPDKENAALGRTN